MRKQWVCGCCGLVVSGCGWILPLVERDVTGEGCPSLSPHLSGDRVTEISPQYQWVAQSGTVTHTEAVAYRFEGKAGQTLKYRTLPSLCVWVFAPNNQLLETDTLPMDGMYLFQVSAPRRRTSFEVQMAIDPFERSSFPKAECGDPKPSDPAAYPVNFYPVNAAYTRENLQKVQSLFCEDAYRKNSQDATGYNIQISSFTNLAKAEGFARFIDEDIAGVRVGPPTTLSTP